MSDIPKRSKPKGTTGPFSFGPGGPIRKFVDFPETKDEIELFIARGFCKDRLGYRPHFDRYGKFSDLKQERENSIDFSVETEFGRRWLELCEFAPLHEFQGSYANVPQNWDVSKLLSLAFALIQKKANKGYGNNTILLIYKTHSALFLPPPIQRALREELKKIKLDFESIYFISPHDADDMSVWEVWPGVPEDNSPIIKGGRIFIGP